MRGLRTGPADLGHPPPVTKNMEVLVVVEVEVAVVAVEVVAVEVVLEVVLEVAPPPARPCPPQGQPLPLPPSCFGGWRRTWTGCTRAPCRWPGCA